ncbi:hypothetical protein GALL_460750 [mine drainage metagenome]|uniref:Uncharacterized protein n=1 Tax=mine drainage metagenome TaxID=410659 RepID=A0A1J5PL88_9ZZZZ
MLRVGENFGCRALLDNLAALHDADTIRDAAHNAQIMGDEQQAHPLVALQVGQQVKDLRLNRHVQRRGRLIRDQQMRPVRQRHRDHHALPLPARKLVRIGTQPLFGIADTYLLQQLHHPRPRRSAGQPLVQRQAFDDLPFQRVQRVQTGHRLLKDKADVVAAHLVQPRRRSAHHLFVTITDRA